MVPSFHGSKVFRNVREQYNTLGKAVGLTGAFSGHIFGLGAAAAAAVAVIATAAAVFSWPPAAAAAESLSAGGRLLLVVVSFLTGVVLGVGCRSGLQQRNKFLLHMHAFWQHRQCCGSGILHKSAHGYGSRVLMTKN